MIALDCGLSCSLASAMEWYVDANNHGCTVDDLRTRLAGILVDHSVSGMQDRNRQPARRMRHGRIAPDQAAPCRPSRCSRQLDSLRTATQRDGRLPAAPAAFRETDPAARQLAAADMPANGAWWLVFADPTLDDLIERADRNNFTIRLAAARLAEARAIQKATAAAQWPTLGLELQRHPRGRTADQCRQQQWHVVCRRRQSVVRSRSVWPPCAGKQSRLAGHR